MGDERGVIGRLGLKGDVVESRLEIDHAHPMGPTQLGSVSSGVVELVLVFVRLLVDRYYVLAYAIGLTGLLAWHK